MASAPSETATQDSAAAVSRATWRVSALTMSSRILGLVRDYCLIAIYVATPWVTDAFVFAFTLPNLFRRLFGEGALSAAFIPVFVDTYENEAPASATKLASRVLTLLILVTGLLASVGIVIALGVNSIGTFDKQIHLTLQLAAIMLPFLCLICSSALLSGMLQSLRCFTLPAAMSIVLNICFLAAFGLITYRMPDGPADQTIFYVAGAVVMAGLIQLLLQYPALAWRGIRLTPALSLGDEKVKAVIKALGPTALGLGIVQVNVLIDNLIAYGLSLGGAEGANTYLYLGNRLMQLPLGVFGIAVATTVFPILSSHFSRGEQSDMLERINRAVRMLLFIILPAGIGLAVTSVPLVRMIFQRSNLAFGDLAVYRTSSVLSCYAGGLVFFSLQHLLTRCFYAQRDYKTPVRIAIWMVGVNLTLNLILIHAPDLYRHWMGDAFYLKWNLAAPDVTPNPWPNGIALGEAGLALATSLTALINVGLLWFKLRKRMLPSIGAVEWEKRVGQLHWSALRIFIAALGMGVFVALTVNSIPYEPELLSLIGRGALPVLLGVVAYYVACLVVPVPELEEFVTMRKKTKREDADKEAEG